MTRRVLMAAGVALLAIVFVTGYRMGHAGAADIPTTNALTFTGSLYTYGAPDNATHTMTAALYVTGQTTAACGPVSASVTTVNGQFSIALPSACVPVIHANPSVQIQIGVDNTTLAPTTLTAVPYAVEADTASNAAAGSSLASGLVPPGTIIAYGGIVSASVAPPTGWLWCNGQAVTSAAYPNLFAAVGASYGGNSSSFNVPDLRGRFVRGVDQGAGNDPDTASRGASNTGGNTGDAVGSLQADQFASHTHQVASRTGDTSADTPVVNRFLSNSPADGFTNSNAVISGGAGGTETRPRNVYANYLIKY